MAFRPQIGDKIEIGTVSFKFTEHPAAKGMPYGQTGRRATVYQVVDTHGLPYALKVFTLAFRNEQTAQNAKKLNKLAKLPGLQAAERNVLSPQGHSDLLDKTPDLKYGVLMPWVEGATWQEVMLNRQELTPGQSKQLARSLVSVLAGMEEKGLAHCDLSGPNVIVQLEPDCSAALVDLEDLYAEDLVEPDRKPSGSDGYAHKTAGKGLWSPEADRFAGAMLLAEMLGWCDERVREAAYGEQYFAPGESQEDVERYTTLRQVLEESWGEEVAKLLDKAWNSKTLKGCPKLADWDKVLKALDQQQVAKSLARVQRLMASGDYAGAVQVAEMAYTLAPDEVKGDYVKALMKWGGEEEDAGNAKTALEHFEQALDLSPGGSLEYELELIVKRLRRGGYGKTAVKQKAKTNAKQTAPNDKVDAALSDFRDSISSKPSTTAIKTSRKTSNSTGSDLKGGLLLSAALLLPFIVLAVFIYSNSSSSASPSSSSFDKPTETSSRPINFGDAETAEFTGESEWYFDGEEGQPIAIRMTSNAFSPRVVLLDSNNDLIVSRADPVDSTPGDEYYFVTVLPQADTYTVVASAYEEDAHGSYNLYVDSLREGTFKGLNGEFSFGKDGLYADDCVVVRETSQATQIQQIEDPWFYYVSRYDNGDLDKSLQILIWGPHGYVFRDYLNPVEADEDNCYWGGFSVDGMLNTPGAYVLEINDTDTIFRQVFTIEKSDLADVDWPDREPFGQISYGRDEDADWDACTIGGDFSSLSETDLAENSWINVLSPYTPDEVGDVYKWRLERISAEGNEVVYDWDFSQLTGDINLCWWGGFSMEGQPQGHYRYIVADEGDNTIDSFDFDIAMTPQGRKPDAGEVSSARDIRMPDLVGMHYRDAATALEDAGLTFSLDNYHNVCDFDVAQGTIIRQEPEAGVWLESSTEIDLYRASIPNIMTASGYSSLKIYSEKGSIDYAAQLEPGSYSLDIGVWTSSPARITKVEFIDSQGRILYEYEPNHFDNGRGSFLEAGPNVFETGCYIARLYYYTFSGEVNRADLESGLIIGNIEIEPK